jgi:uncharacterized membrane protein
VIGGVVLLAQLVALFLMSAYLFHRFDLTDDFATYNQAFSLIWHGHPNPVDTIHSPSFPFWQNHFELAMWPLSTLSFLWPHSLWLLWMQDVAIVASEAIAALWITRYLAALGARRSALFAALAFVLLLTNAWWYEAASFDVHLEVLGIPLVVLAAYALWSGSTTRVFVAAGLALLFGDVVATYIVLVGLAAMVSPRVRREGRLAAAGGVVVLGVAWFALATVLHANQGSGIVSNYGYLVSASQHASSAHVLGHLVLEPGRVAGEVFDQWRNLGHLLASSGIVGVLSPWGFLMYVGVAGPSALNVNKAFVSPQIAFQTLVVVPFMIVGTVAVLLVVAGVGVSPPRATRKTGGKHRARPPSEAARPPRLGSSRPQLAVAVGAIVLVLALIQNVPLLSQLRSQWWRVDPAAAATLRSALPLVPGNAEVIASQGVIGRFAGREFVYALLTAPQAFPIAPGHPVVLVIVPKAGLETMPALSAQADIQSVMGLRGARVLTRGSGAVVVEWHPPEGKTLIVLP